MIKDSATLLIGGWVLSRGPEDVITYIFGSGARFTAIDRKAGSWWAEFPLSPECPVGRIERIIVFGADRPVEIELVPGSQGHREPPEDAGELITRVLVPPGRTLLADARCWW